MKKGFVWIIFGAFLFVALIAGLYYYHVYPVRQRPGLIDTFTASPSPSGQGLAKYQNVRFGFGFNYPSDFIADKTPVSPTEPGGIVDSFQVPLAPKSPKGAQPVRLKIEYHPVNCEHFHRFALTKRDHLLTMVPEFTAVDISDSNQIPYFLSKAVRNDELITSLIFNYGNFCPFVSLSSNSSASAKIADSAVKTIVTSVAASKQERDPGEIYQLKEGGLRLTLPSGFQTNELYQDETRYKVEIGSTISDNSLFTIESVKYKGSLADLKTKLEKNSPFSSGNFIFDFTPTNIVVNQIDGLLWIKANVDAFFVHNGFAYHFSFKSLQNPDIYKILDSIKFN